MITSERKFWVRCDHMHYDSAALGAGWLMAGVAAGSLGCHVEAGPFSSFEAARGSLACAGWFRRELAAAPGITAVTWLACPLHRAEAETFWLKVDNSEYPR